MENHVENQLSGAISELLGGGGWKKSTEKNSVITIQLFTDMLYLCLTLGIFFKINFVCKINRGWNIFWYPDKIKQKI